MHACGLESAQGPLTHIASSYQVCQVEYDLFVSRWAGVGPRGPAAAPDWRQRTSSNVLGTRDTREFPFTQGARKESLAERARRASRSPRPGAVHGLHDGLKCSFRFAANDKRGFQNQHSRKTNGVASRTLQHTNRNRLTHDGADPYGHTTHTHTHTHTQTHAAHAARSSQHAGSVTPCRCRSHAALRVGRRRSRLTARPGPPPPRRRRRRGWGWAAAPAGRCAACSH